jgi:outer membrane biosynthesis protein TonB
MADLARSGMGLPMAISLALHGSAALALLLARAPKPPVVPPIYQVNIVAAPPGPRAEGVVTPAPAAEVPPDAKVPPRAETNPRDMPLPTPPVQRKRPPPPPTTPTPAPTTSARPDPKAPAPQAGGGPIGGRGTDVANVRTEGIEFPFPGYLNNIVRQIALRFNPPNPNAPLQAEVMFLIHRDGSISSMRFLTRSRVYAFDLEAQAAIEAAARDRAFGSLPEGFNDDVLPIVFSFDPRLVR